MAREEAWGAFPMALPEEAVQRLGLTHHGRRRVRFADGRSGEVPWAANVMIEIHGREMSTDAVVLPSGSKSLIGQLQLEGLDLVVHARTGEAVPNQCRHLAPAGGGGASDEHRDPTVRAPWLARALFAHYRAHR
jgi:hypothetical protein